VKDLSPGYLYSRPAHLIIPRNVQAWGNQKSNLRTLVGVSPKHILKTSAVEIT